MPTKEDFQKTILSGREQLEDIQRRYEAALAQEANEEAQEEKRLAPKLEKEYTFSFSHRTLTKHYQGAFTNKILSIRERQFAGLLQARFAAGVPFDQMSPFTRELNLILAHLEVSLVKRPDWAQDLASIEDYTVLQEIYSEVASHEATFLGYEATQEEGEGTSKK